MRAFALERPQPEMASGLISTLAHELRQPVTALALSSAALAQDAEVFGPQEIGALASGIHRRALWLQGVVENLLATAQAHQVLPLMLQTVSAADVIEDVEPIVGPVLAQRRQRLRVRGKTTVPPMQADRRRVAHALLNLIGNANKYGRERTPIDVRFSVAGGFLRISVSDRGPGLPKRSVETLFRPFLRVEVPGASSTGLGLGLAIVEQVASAHRGRVGARPRPGGGATVWFEIPLRDREARRSRA